MMLAINWMNTTSINHNCICRGSGHTLVDCSINYLDEQGMFNRSLDIESFLGYPLSPETTPAWTTNAASCSWADLY